MILDGIFDLFNGKKKSKPKPDTEQASAPRPKKSAKELATDKGEPYISVIKVNVDKSNPRYGSFELDWNTIFVQSLVESGGYRGDKEEDIVDQWFQDVCRHVVLETYEQDQANVNRSDNIVRYINRSDLGGGRSEVS